MRWFGWFRNKPEVIADVVAGSGRRKDGVLIDEQERLNLLASYERRIAQCDVEIEKWTIRKSGRAYTNLTLPEITEMIASIKASKLKFENLIKQNRN